MGMLGFLGWMCVNISVYKRCLFAIPAFVIKLNHQLNMTNALSTLIFSRSSLLAGADKFC